MNRCVRLGFFATAFFSVRTIFAFDAYNDFGPGDSYDPSTGYGVTGSDYAPFVTRLQAARFTSEASGMLAVVRMSVHEVFHMPAGFNQVDVRLHNADAFGNIGPIIAAFTRGGLTDFGLSDPPFTITSFDPAVTLTTGNQYWIVVAPGDRSTDAVWNWDAGAGGRRAFSTDGGLTYSYLEGRLGAMRIEVVTIPEPAAFASFLIAAVGMAFRRARRR